MTDIISILRDNNNEELKPILQRASDNIEDLLTVLCALGAIGGGHCFCSDDRDPDKEEHEPECRNALIAIAEVRRTHD